MKRLVLALALAGGAVVAHAAPLTDLSGGQTGRIEFRSITPPDRWQFVRKNLNNTKEVTVYGDLVMPGSGDQKIPAVVISHDSGGVTPNFRIRNAPTHQHPSQARICGRRKRIPINTASTAAGTQ